MTHGLRWIFGDGLCFVAAIFMHWYGLCYCDVVGAKLDVEQSLKYFSDDVKMSSMNTALCSWSFTLNSSPTHLFMESMSACNNDVN